MRGPTIRPFRAVRYDRRVAGDLGALLAPPYDVSSPDLIARLHRRSPLNMTHLEHVRPDPGNDPHATVASRYRKWRADGVLRRDEQPAFYRYDHTFTLQGERRTRRGIFATVRLAHWEECIVLPHERTFPGPVAERHGRLRAVGANLSPVYLLANDRTGGFRQILEAGGVDDLVATTDPDGESHALSRIDDPGTIEQIARVVGDSQLYVADGHHRYEAALAHRDERRIAEQPSQAHGAEYVLALVADASDPNVVILPTHRMIRKLPELDPSAIRARLEEHFILESVATLNSPHEMSSDPETISLMRIAGERGWWRIGFKPSRPHADLMPVDRSPAWRQLPAAILESVVFEHVLGLEPAQLPGHVGFTHEAETAIGAIEQEEAQLAFLLPPPSVADLIAVADAGDRMPAKSTYFQPKVPAGLVIYDFVQP